MSVIDSVHYNIKGILWLRSNDVQHLAEEFNSDYGQVKTYRSLHSTDCKDVSKCILSHVSYTLMS